MVYADDHRSICGAINVFMTEAFADLPSLDVRLDDKFWGGRYGLYLVGGFFIVRRKVLAKIRTAALGLIAAAAFGLNIIAQYYLYSHNFFKTNGLYSYNSAAVFLSGLIVFELLRRFLEEKKIREAAFLEYVSRSRFGVYLLHKPLLILLEKYLPLEGMHTLIKIGILFAVGMFGSLLVTVPFYCSWKKAGRLLFHIKQ